MWVSLLGQGVTWTPIDFHLNWELDGLLYYCKSYILVWKYKIDYYFSPRHSLVSESLLVIKLDSAFTLVCLIKKPVSIIYLCTSSDSQYFGFFIVSLQMKTCSKLPTTQVRPRSSYALWTRDVNMSVQINLLNEHYQRVLEIDQISKTIQLIRFVWQERLRLRKDQVLSSSRSGARNQDSYHILSSDSSRKLMGLYEDILQGCNYGSGIVSFFLALDCSFISKSNFFSILWSRNYILSF